MGLEVQQTTTANTGNPFICIPILLYSSLCACVILIEQSPLISTIAKLIAFHVLTQTSSLVQCLHYSNGLLMTGGKYISCYQESSDGLFSHIIVSINISK